ncbi:hypothetical protein PR048_033435 [Dryococelus australis]|uniref:Uncharacterized protein n=1 Tax=Dryococelus australis TaxID=614101 RepID=A0ABQ9G0A3_9NEOP|nr:hypothetical protein PR048_033435 [Dryococelus australis]
MRVIEASMEQRRNGREVETGDPREDPPTIPTCENPVTRPGIEPGSACWEAGGLTTRPPRPRLSISRKLHTFHQERAPLPVLVGSQVKMSHYVELTPVTLLYPLAKPTWVFCRSGGRKAVSGDEHLARFFFSRENYYTNSTPSPSPPRQPKPNHTPACDVLSYFGAAREEHHRPARDSALRSVLQPCVLSIVHGSSSEQRDIREQPNPQSRVGFTTQKKKKKLKDETAASEIEVHARSLFVAVRYGDTRVPSRCSKNKFSQGNPGRFQSLLSRGKNRATVHANPDYSFQKIPLLRTLFRSPSPQSCEPMRVFEVNTERRRNEGAVETGNPRENPPTNGIVRHDSHLRKSGDPAGDWWEASVLTARHGSYVFQALNCGPAIQLPETVMANNLQNGSRRLSRSNPWSSWRRKRDTKAVVRASRASQWAGLKGLQWRSDMCFLWAAAAEWLGCSPPTKANRIQSPGRAPLGFSHVVIAPDDAASRWVFLGDLPFPSPLHSGAAPYSPSLHPHRLSRPRCYEPPKSLHSLHKCFMLPAHNNELLIADEGCSEVSMECKGGGNWKTPEKTRRPVASSGTIPMCENPGATAPLGLARTYGQLFSGAKYFIDKTQISGNNRRCQTDSVKGANAANT